MLESYFQPRTVDRIRASWIAGPIEQYVAWLEALGYARRNVFHRVPVLMQFGEFTRDHGAKTYEELPAHVGRFIECWIQKRPHCRQRPERRAVEARRPVEQMLRLVVAGPVEPASRSMAEPFQDTAPGFFDYLRNERGLRATTVKLYLGLLRRFQAYLVRIEVDRLSSLSTVILDAFITDAGQDLSKETMCGLCSALRVFLSYLYREGTISWNPTGLVERPRIYRLANIPRSIGWDDVRRLLDAVDRRTSIGKRDYAMLLLMVTYGLRAREIAALTLDDIDWKRERLKVPERKAGHSTAFPLSASVGNAILDYLRLARPKTSDRQIFFKTVAPYRPVTFAIVSGRTTRYLSKAGVSVPRPGSHTLRHTCVQQLVEASFPLKVIGDYVGHRSPSSTEVYGKVALEKLRDVALGHGEDIL